MDDRRKRKRKVFETVGKALVTAVLAVLLAAPSLPSGSLFLHHLDDHSPHTHDLEPMQGPPPPISNSSGIAFETADKQIADGGIDINKLPKNVRFVVPPEVLTAAGAILMALAYGLTYYRRQQSAVPPAAASAVGRRDRRTGRPAPPRMPSATRRQRPRAARHRACA